MCVTGGRGEALLRIPVCRDDLAPPLEILEDTNSFYLLLPKSEQRENRTESVWSWLRRHRDLFKHKSVDNSKVCKAIRIGYLYLHIYPGLPERDGKLYIVAFLFPRDGGQTERQVMFPMSGNQSEGYRMYLPGVTINGTILSEAGGEKCSCGCGSEDTIPGSIRGDPEHVRS